MREFITKHKKAFTCTIIICCLACLVLGGIIGRRIYIGNKADALFAAGDYVSAKAEFEKIGRSDKMAECDYAYTLSRLENARQLMESGSLELAKAELVLLGDFENAPELPIKKILNKRTVPGILGLCLAFGLLDNILPLFVEGYDSFSRMLRAIGSCICAAVPIGFFLRWNSRRQRAKQERELSYEEREKAARRLVEELADSVSR